MVVLLPEQILYYILVEVILGKTVKRDKRYLTSFRYLVQSPKSLPARFVFSCGKKHAVFMYGVMQESYTVLNCLPAYAFLK